MSGGSADCRRSLGGDCPGLESGENFLLGCASAGVLPNLQAERLGKGKWGLGAEATSRSVHRVGVGGNGRIVPF